MQTEKKEWKLLYFPTSLFRSRAARNNEWKKEDESKRKKNIIRKQREKGKVYIMGQFFFLLLFCFWFRFSEWKILFFCYIVQSRPISLQNLTLNAIIFTFRLINLNIIFCFGAFFFFILHSLHSNKCECLWRTHTSFFSIFNLKKNGKNNFFLFFLREQNRKSSLNWYFAFTTIFFYFFICVSQIEI